MKLLKRIVFIGFRCRRNQRRKLLRKSTYSTLGESSDQGPMGRTRNDRCAHDGTVGGRPRGAHGPQLLCAMGARVPGSHRPRPYGRPQRSTRLRIAAPPSTWSSRRRFPLLLY